MYNQTPQKIKPPQLDDDVDSFMQQRAKAPAMPKAAPSDDVDAFMSKRAAPVSVVHPKTDQHRAYKTNYADDMTEATTESWGNKPLPTYEDWRKSGSKIVPPKFSTGAPNGQFKSPVSMDFRGQTEAEKMAGRALAPVVQPAPHPKPRNAFQVPVVRKTQLERIQDQQAVEQRIQPDNRTTRQKVLAGGPKSQPVTPPEDVNWAQDKISRFGRAAVGTIPGAISGTAKMADAMYGGLNRMTGNRLPTDGLSSDWSPVVSPPMESAQKGIEDSLPIDPSRNEDFSSKIASGLGSAAGFGKIGGAARAIGLPFKSAIGAAGVGLGADEISREMKEVGFRRELDPARYDRAVMMGGATGLTELVGLGKTLEKFGLKRAALQRGVEVLENSGQEAFQQWMGNVNAVNVGAYDLDREQGKGVLEAAILGGIVSGGVQAADLGMQAAQPAPIPQQIADRALANQNNAIRAERAPMPGIRPTGQALPTQITPLSRTAAVSQPATPIPAIDPTVTTPKSTNEPTVNPQVAAESQPSALPRLPARELTAEDRFAQAYGAKAPAENRLNKMIDGGEALLNSPRENDRKQGETMLKRSLTQIQKSEGYQAELGLPDDAPKPYTAVVAAIEEKLAGIQTGQNQQIEQPESASPAIPQDAAGKQTAELPAQQTATGALRAEADAAKIKAAEFEQAGDFEQAAATHEATHRNLKLLRRKIGVPKTAEDVARINQIDREVSIAATNMQKAKVQARQIAKQANAPTAGLPKSQQDKITNNNVPLETAPLLRPEAVQNPEGGIPEMPEQTFSGRLDQGIRKQDAQKPSAPAKRLISRIQELGGISNHYGGELQGVKDAHRIGVVRNKATMSPDILARQLQSEGYDIDPENLDTLWAAIDRDVAGKNERPANTADLNQRLKDEEADYYAQQEEAVSEPTKSFDQIDEEVRGRRHPPAPARPQQVGNRPMSVDVAGTRTPVAMSAGFPRARREMVRAGREVEARLEMGQEKGEFGNFANAMFKSNSPDVLHGQDSFFHDPDVKGKLGLTRDAEMGEVRKELKTQLARSLDVTVDEVSLSHIKPDVWRAWARQKGLGRTAMQKLEAGINRAERKENAIKTNAQVNAEESQRGKESVREPEGKAAENKADVILARAKERQLAATDDMRGLRPTEDDWMTSQEKEVVHKDRLAQGRMASEEQAAAKERVKEKRAARQAEAAPIKPGDSLAEHRANLMAKAKAYDERGTVRVRDVTPEGYAPGESTSESQPAPLPKGFESTADEQKIKSSIAETETLLRGRLSPEKRAQIERGVESSKAKLAELQGETDARFGRRTPAKSASEIDRDIPNRKIPKNDKAFEGPQPGDQFYKDDSVTWQSGDKTASGKVTKVNGSYVTAEAADGETITRDKSKFTAAAKSTKLSDLQVDKFVSDESDSLRQEWGILRNFNKENLEGALDNARVQTSHDPVNERAGIIYVNSNAKIVLDEIWSTHTGSALPSALAFDREASSVMGEVLRFEASSLEGSQAKQVNDLAAAFEKMGGKDYDGAGLINVDLANQGHYDLARNHELFHLWQFGQEQPNDPNRQPMKVDWATKVNGYGKVRDWMVAKDYKDNPETIVREFAAYAATNDLAKMGFSPNEAETVATDFLYEYFNQVADQYGAQHLERIGRISIPARSIIERVSNEKGNRPTQASTTTSGESRRREPTTSSPSRIAVSGIRLPEGKEDRRSERREERIASRTASKESRASFGSLANEPTGEVLGVFPGNLQKWLGSSKPKAQTAPTKPEPVPADWNQKKWTKKAMDALITRDMPKDDREKFFDFSTKKAERLALLQKYMPSTHDIDALADVLDRTEKAVKHNDGDDLREAVWAARAITERPATNADKASTLMRAAMFSRVTGRMRDVIGDSAMQKLEMAARIPGSAADIVFTTMRRALGGGGERAYLGPRPIDFLKNRSADRAKQWKQAKDVMKGKHVDALEDILQHREVNFDNKFLDKATKGVFRVMGAIDQFFFVKEYERAIREQAEIQARADVRSGVINKTDRQKQADYYAAAPTVEMKVLAEIAAKQIVFRNPNIISDKIQILRENLSPGGNFALDIVMPVDRTPTNVILAALEYSPLGFAKLGGQMTGGTLKAAAGTIRNRKTMPTRAAIKKALDDAFPPDKQRKMSRLFGRTVVGTSGPVLLGYLLATAGMATGFYDEDDPGEEAERRAEGKMPNSVKIAGRWWELSGIAPLGSLIGLGATLHREINSKALDPEKRYKRLMKGFGNMAMDLPALESAKQTVKIGKDLTGTPSNIGRVAGNIGARFVPGLLGDIGQVIPGVRDPFEREVKAPKSGDKTLRSMAGKAGREFVGEFATKIPGARRLLPPKMGPDGKPVETEWSDGFDPFRSRKAVDLDQLSETKGAMRKFDISTEVKPKPGEPDGVYKQRVERVGKWMEGYGQKLIDNPRYKALPEAEQKQAIESLRRRIGRQQNLKRPNERSFEPNAVLLGVKKSARERPKREARQLYTPQP